MAPAEGCGGGNAKPGSGFFDAQSIDHAGGVLQVHFWFAKAGQRRAGQGVEGCEARFAFEPLAIVFQAVLDEMFVAAVRAFFHCRLCFAEKQGALNQLLASDQRLLGLNAFRGRQRVETIDEFFEWRRFHGIAIAGLIHSTCYTYNALVYNWVDTKPYLTLIPPK